MTDVAKWGQSEVLHVAFQGLHSYVRAHGGELPAAGDAVAAAEVFAMTVKVNEEMKAIAAAEAEAATVPVVVGDGVNVSDVVAELGANAAALSEVVADWGAIGSETNATVTAVNATIAAVSASSDTDGECNEVYVCVCVVVKMIDVLLLLLLLLCCCCCCCFCC